MFYIFLESFSKIFILKLLAMRKSPKFSKSHISAGFHRCRLLFFHIVLPISTTNSSTDGSLALLCSEEFFLWWNFFQNKVPKSRFSSQKWSYLRNADELMAHILPTFSTNEYYPLGNGERQIAFPVGTSLGFVKKIVQNEVKIKIFNTKMIASLKNRWVNGSYWTNFQYSWALPFGKFRVSDRFSSWHQPQNRHFRHKNDHISETEMS